MLNSLIMEISIQPQLWDINNATVTNIMNLAMDPDFLQEDGFKDGFTQWKLPSTFLG